MNIPGFGAARSFVTDVATRVIPTAQAARTAAEQVIPTLRDSATTVATNVGHYGIVDAAMKYPKTAAAMVGTVGAAGVSAFASTHGLHGVLYNVPELALLGGIPLSGAAAWEVVGKTPEMARVHIGSAITNMASRAKSLAQLNALYGTGIAGMSGFVGAASHGSGYLPAAGVGLLTGGFHFLTNSALAQSLNPEAIGRNMISKVRNAMPTMDINILNKRVEADNARDVLNSLYRQATGQKGLLSPLYELEKAYFQRFPGFARGLPGGAKRVATVLDAEKAMQTTAQNLGKVMQQPSLTQEVVEEITLADGSKRMGRTLQEGGLRPFLATPNVVDIHQAKQAVEVRLITELKNASEGSFLNDLGNLVKRSLPGLADPTSDMARLKIALEMIDPRIFATMKPELQQELIGSVATAYKQSLKDLKPSDSLITLADKTAQNLGILLANTNKADKSNAVQLVEALSSKKLKETFEKQLAARSDVGKQLQTMQRTMQQVGDVEKKVASLSAYSKIIQDSTPFDTHAWDAQKLGKLKPADDIARNFHNTLLRIQARLPGDDLTDFLPPAIAKLAPDKQSDYLTGIQSAIGDLLSTDPQIQAKAYQTLAASGLYQAPAFKEVNDTLTQVLKDLPLKNVHELATKTAMPRGMGYGTDRDRATQVVRLTELVTGQPVTRLTQPNSPIYAPNALEFLASR